jgi:hypothetical protein
VVVSIPPIYLGGLVIFTTKNARRKAGHLIVKQMVFGGGVIAVSSRTP